MRRKRSLAKWFGFLALVVSSLAFHPWAMGQATQEVVIGFTGPLSGVAAEYGQDCVNGIEMAIQDINKAGGVTVGGKKYSLKLVKLDDQIDPTQAVNNCRRLKDQHKAAVIFNPVFNTLAAMAKINEEKGNEFLIMAYTSTPKMVEMGNKLAVAIPPPFTAYVRTFSELAWEEGWRKAAMVVTLGAYGDEWRAAFRDYWQKKGGQITEDKPANYYAETDFSAQLTAALATKPDFLLIGGPSATTALVIEQARSLGFKGGFVFVDQAKVDYIENILKGVKLLGNTIGVAAVRDIPTPSIPAWEKRYKETYKRMPTWEAVLNYGAAHAVARAMEAAGTTTDAVAIRAAFPKAFPMLGDKFPSEYHGITPGGRIHCPASIQKLDPGGKYGSVLLAAWWFKDKVEFDKFKAGRPAQETWAFFKHDKEE
ncbi:MAG: ABC transporter substrate-binding protein [Thermodesulfobacteriota bacterium]